MKTKTKKTAVVKKAKKGKVADRELIPISLFDWKTLKVVRHTISKTLVITIDLTVKLTSKIKIGAKKTDLLKATMVIDESYLVESFVLHSAVMHTGGNRYVTKYTSGRINHEAKMFYDKLKYTSDKYISTKKTHFASLAE